MCVIAVFSTSSNLQFSTKQMERAAKRCEKDQKTQQAKVKKVSLLPPSPPHPSSLLPYLPHPTPGADSRKH